MHDPNNNDNYIRIGYIDLPGRSQYKAMRKSLVN